MKHVSGVAKSKMPQSSNVLSLIAYLRYALPEVQAINSSSASLLCSAIAGLEDQVTAAGEAKAVPRCS